MSYQQDDFDSLMSRMNAGGAPGSFCTAMVDVADAAYACKLWFESNGLRPTAADVVAMTRLVLEREAGLGDRLGQPQLRAPGLGAVAQPAGQRRSKARVDEMPNASAFLAPVDRPDGP
jgi:hypothetical protein